LDRFSVPSHPFLRTDPKSEREVVRLLNMINLEATVMI
jgi:hypothetical protein